MPGQKNVHGIQPNVSAYKNGVPPPPYMEARSRKQAHGSKHRKPSSETINLAVEKKSLGPAQIHAGQKKYPHRVQKTHKHVPHIFCALGPKKIMVRSKKHVQVQKKGGQVQKTCIPYSNGWLINGFHYWVYHITFISSGWWFKPL